MPSKAARSWIRIDVPCDAENADDLAALIAGEFGVGAEVADAGVRFYLEEDKHPDDWESRLRVVLEEFREMVHPAKPLTFVRSHIAEEDWADRWKAYFKPLRIGHRFMIRPTWEEVEPRPRDVVITINPGRAFGTGHHETTRLCLEWLEEWEEARGGLIASSLLDVGTGSGILAMGGALLGCEPVVAVDVDPEAIEVALENLGLNGLLEKVQLREGSAEDVSQSFDIVVANIQASPLIRMAPVLAKRVKDSGRLVLSGILREQKNDVQEACEQARLTLCDTKYAGEWCLLVLGHGER